MNNLQTTDFNAMKFFKGCVWDLKEYPDEEIRTYFERKKNTVIDLTDIAETPLYDDMRDIFIGIFTKQNPYSYQSTMFSFVMNLMEFMLAQGYKSILEISDLKKADNLWQDYWQEHGKRSLSIYKKFISKCAFTLTELRDKRIGLERDLWRLPDIKINDERINKSGNASILNFGRIKDAGNREILKTWFRYQLGCTELAFSTIYLRFSLCEPFVSFLGKKSLLDITHRDIEKYRLESQFSPSRNNNIMGCLKSLYTYLAANDIFCGDCPVKKLDFMYDDSQYKKTSVPETTIFEIFRHLHELPEEYLLIYLINLFTGIRISDICQLKTDCLYENEHGYFLSHDVQKMQDIGAIPISKELYRMIEKRIYYINHFDRIYLFQSRTKENYPLFAQSYSRYMKNIIKEWDIRLPDGNPYLFTTHAYRHTIATQLFQMGMPSALIQIGILHHKEINMSRHYIEIDAESQLNTMNDKGINVPSVVDSLKADGGGSALPNGFCNMPLKIECPELASCLDCEFFRTSIKFIDVHRKHLENIIEQIAYYRQKGYEQNFVFAEKTKDKLEQIIKSLEKIMEDDNDETDSKKRNIKTGNTEF